MGEVYAQSDWALRTNEMSIAKLMPLLSEFSRYSELGKEAKRWEKTLHNDPVSSGIEYSIVNLRESSEITDNESGGHLKHKQKIKVGENEEAIKNRVVSEPINIEWMFVIFKARHHEPAGKPISRITKQLNALDSVIGMELGIG